MSNYLDKTRLIVAKREGESGPMVIAALPQPMWEVLPPEEWDAWKRKRAEDVFSFDWPAYDYIEVVITIPVGQLAEMFDAREVTPTSIEVGDS